MGILTKIRNLYRFDGDTEPVQLSRRSFFFVGGVVAAGAMLPNVLAPIASDVVACAMEKAWYPAILTPPATLVAYDMDRAARPLYVRRLKLNMDLYRGRQWEGAPPGEWLFLDGKVPTS